ncbi:hypothetical protein EGD00_12970 [Pectobacterium carotovorum subsp. carotovorum]|nr:hypothetical protein EGD00_12970 [Pectobacterium carotovorum subsp. carotovorum]
MPAAPQQKLTMAYYNREKTKGKGQKTMKSMGLRLAWNQAQFNMTYLPDSRSYRTEGGKTNTYQARTVSPCNWQLQAKT